jgi:hypothetical protein
MDNTTYLAILTTLGPPNQWIKNYKYISVVTGLNVPKNFKADRILDNRITAREYERITNGTDNNSI